MIKTDYIITCDQCENRGPYDRPSKLHILAEFGEILVGSIWKRLRKAGWARINGKDWCPSCVASTFVEDSPKVRKASARNVGKLSKTAREALAARIIDDD